MIVPHHLSPTESAQVSKVFEPHSPRSYKRFKRWWSGVMDREPGLFAYWRWVRMLAGFR